MASLPLFKYENETGELNGDITPEGKLLLSVGDKTYDPYMSIELDTNEVVWLLIRLGKFSTKEKF